MVPLLVPIHGRVHQSCHEGERVEDGEGDEELVECVAQVALHAHHAEDNVAGDPQDGDDVLDKFAN